MTSSGKQYGWQERLEKAEKLKQTKTHLTEARALVLWSMSEPDQWLQEVLLGPIDAMTIELQEEIEFLQGDSKAGPKHAK